MMLGALPYYQLAQTECWLAFKYAVMLVFQPLSGGAIANSKSEQNCQKVTCT
jgi:hypothetical protein